MSLLQEIKADLDAARKARNQNLLTILTTLYSEAAMVGKTTRNGESTDEEVIRIVRRFKDGVTDIVAIRGASFDTDVELSIYERYLPKMISEDDLSIIIVQFVNDNLLPDRSPKHTGIVMKHLKDNFGGRYDGKLASELVKKALS